MRRFPTDEDRHVITGSTGSGKTVAAMYALSYRNFDKMPWIIYDYKGDKHIAQIDGALPIGINELPERQNGISKPGIYIVRPLPDDDIQPQLWEIWERGKMGIYVDEGYMMGRFNRPWRAILTQGRSKQIPIITLTQRPVWNDPFVFSEANFIQVYRLQLKDRLKAQEYVEADLSNRLPEYHSYYYDVGTNTTHKLSAVPAPDEILATFRARLRRRVDTL